MGGKKNFKAVSEVLKLKKRRKNVFKTFLEQICHMALLNWQVSTGILDSCLMTNWTGVTYAYYVTSLLVF